MTDHSLPVSVSVIIPTYNGRHRIGKLLSALEQQTRQPMQVIIVIDGSTDGTEDMLATGTWCLPLIMHVQKNQGRAAVRNTGAKLATGNLLLFLDDDMRPEPACISEHIRMHQEHPDALITGAQIDDERTATCDFLLYKSWLTRKWAAPLQAINTAPLPLDRIHLTAANFSVTPHTFHLLGGFDERLRDAEDFDLAIRAYKAGVPVYYHHEAFAWHDDKVTIRSYIRRLREYRRAHETLRNLKPEQYNDIAIREPYVPTGIKKQGFYFFAQPRWIRLVENNKLRLLPKKWRYKIYALVTTAYGSYFPDKDKAIFNQ